MNWQLSRSWLLLLAICGCARARYGNHVPKFYAQDSAIIVDTDKVPLAQRFAHPRYHLLSAYPRYQIVPANAVPSTTTTTTTTTTTEAPSNEVAAALDDLDSTSLLDEEFPRDLLELAQERLGLRRLDEIPSITELGKLLGTNSAAETVRYIRQLTTTEQGIALIKAYIESADYTDSSNDATARNDERKNVEYDDGDDDDNNELPNDKLDDGTANEDDDDGDADGVDDEDELAALKELEVMRRQVSTSTVSPSITTTTKPSAGFFERMFNYMNIYSLWPAAASAEIKPATTEAPPARAADSMTVEFKTPLLMRQPLPYHYPIPMKPLPPKETAPSLPIAMNKPKFTLSPQMHNLIQAATNISPKKIESFLQTKPKLAQLATRVNNFPLSFDRGTQVESQLVAAVQKAIEQDEDLKKLLNSTETLK